jgi:hypothetical protein
MKHCYARLSRQSCPAQGNGKIKKACPTKWRINLYGVWGETYILAFPEALHPMNPAWAGREAVNRGAEKIMRCLHGTEKI